MSTTRSSGSLGGRSRATIVAVSAALFAAVFAARVLIDSSQQGVLLLLGVPIALLAIEFGLPGGLAAATLATGLTALYGVLEHPDFGPIGYISRIASFVLIGGVVGALTTREQAATRARETAESRLAIESAHRESERLKAAILDGALDSLVTIDHRGRVIDFNRAAESTFGYTATEAIGRELAELIIPPGDRDRHRAGLERRISRNEGSMLDRRVELTAMRKDGSSLPVEVAVTRVPGTDPPVFAGYIRDITDVRRTEERALKQSRAIADLAQARGELVSQLMQAEERTRQRIAQVLHDDALQLLLAAHQDLVEAAPGREGVRRAQQALEGTIDRLREAVAALHPVTHQQGDLQTALGAIARQHASRGGFRYTVRVEPDAAGFEDELVLSAARELLSNVAKHARASRCSVAVAWEDDMIRLEVADDGVGIPPGRQEEALKGGHIGLASTIQRLKAIGGEGSVSSGADKGTVVRAWIPVGSREPARVRRG